MAKINVEFDTKDKVLNVMLNGTKIDNVSSVEFFSGYEGKDFHGSITTIEKVEDDDMIKIMRVSAEQEEVITRPIVNVSQQLARKLFPKRMV